MIAPSAPKRGATVGIKLTRLGGTVEGERIMFTPFDPKDLEKYPGTYWSDELETQYTVLLKDGKLLADHSQTRQSPSAYQLRSRVAHGQRTVHGKNRHQRLSAEHQPAL
jgi:hypothetical protein